MENKFEVIARAIILKNEKILACKRKDKDYYFLPGGHVEFGEKSEEALARELKEELNLSVDQVSYISTVENIYEQDNGKHHEINLIFNVLANSVEDKSYENHIDFFFFEKEKFSKEKVLPVTLKKAIIQWQKDKKIFWLSSDKS